MTTKTLSPTDLDDRLAALAEAMAEAEQDVDLLSLPAASGDVDAVAKLAKAQAKCVALQRDKEILHRARQAAVTQVEVASQAEAEAARQAAKDRAIGHAKRLTGMAQRIDLLAAEYRTLINTMPEVERDIHKALNLAGEPVYNTGVVGRHGIAASATNVMQSASLPTSLRARPCSEVAICGWGYLTAEDI